MDKDAKQIPFVVRVKHLYSLFTPRLSSLKTWTYIVTTLKTFRRSASKVVSIRFVKTRKTIYVEPNRNHTMVNVSYVVDQRVGLRCFSRQQKPILIIIVATTWLVTRLLTYKWSMGVSSSDKKSLTLVTQFLLGLSLTNITLIRFCEHSCIYGRFYIRETFASSVTPSTSTQVENTRLTCCLGASSDDR